MAVSPSYQVQTPTLQTPQGPSLDGCVKIADFGISKRLGGAALARWTMDLGYWA